MPHPAYNLNEKQQAFFTHLYVTYYPIMKQRALSVAKTHPLAEDIVHDALVRLLPKYEVLSLLSEQQLIFYIVKTVKCAAIDLLRSRQKDAQVSSSEDLNAWLSDCETPEYVYERKETFNVLSDAVRQLPDEMRVLLVNKYLLSLSTNELASLLQTTQDNIRQRLSRARKRLLSLLGGKHDEEGC